MDNTNCITYSRGAVITDSHPEQRSASSFDGFANEILSDRAPYKGLTYFCGPLACDEEGRTRRRKDNALPRAFLAFDIDGVKDQDTFNQLRLWLLRYKGFGYTTASHTPENPRARIVLAPSRPVNREEGARACKAIQEQIEAEFGLAAIKFDQSVYQAEQALYTPLEDALSFHFDGELADIDTLLSSVPVAETRPSSKERLLGAAMSDPVLARLSERGMVKQDMGGGKYAVDCPCGEAHSAPSSETATVYYLPNTGGYAYGKFNCMHDHCRERDQADYLKALDLDPHEVWATQKKSDCGLVPATYALDSSKPGKPKIRFTPIQDLVTRSCQQEWLVEGFIEKESLALVYGASSAGKSFLCVSIASSIATGRPWFENQVRQGWVLYIAGEGKSGLGRRFKAWGQHHGLAFPPDSVLISNTPASLCDAKGAAAVAEVVEDLAQQHGAPALIIIDTLHRNFGGGDENSAADMGKFINNIDTLLKSRFNCAVLIVHHTGHGDSSRVRGSSSIHAAVDHEYRMELKNNIRTLVCTKNKEGRPLSDMSFTLHNIVVSESGTPPVPSAVLVGVSAPSISPREQPLPTAPRVALNSLLNVLAEQSPPETSVLDRLGLEPGIKVVPEKEWRDRAFADGISTGNSDAKKKAFTRAKGTLLEKGHVSGKDGYYWSVKKEPMTHGPI